MIERGRGKERRRDRETKRQTQEDEDKERQASDETIRKKNEESVKMEIDSEWKAAILYGCFEDKVIHLRAMREAGKVIKTQVCC